MEDSLGRTPRKPKSVASLSGLSATNGDGGPPAEVEAQQPEMSFARRELLQKENGIILASMANELDDVIKIETKVREIAELMNVFSLKVAQQQEDVTSIFDMTQAANDDINKGLDELIRSSKSSRRFRYAYMTFVLTLSILLLMLDFVYN